MDWCHKTQRTYLGSLVLFVNLLKSSYLHYFPHFPPATPGAPTYSNSMWKQERIALNSSTKCVQPCSAQWPSQPGEHRSCTNKHWFLPQESELSSGSFKAPSTSHLAKDQTKKKIPLQVIIYDLKCLNQATDHSPSSWESKGALLAAQKPKKNLN